VAHQPQRIGGRKLTEGINRGIVASPGQFANQPRDVEGGGGVEVQLAVDFDLQLVGELWGGAACCQTRGQPGTRI
jgi:hypothetical protein